jgi:hypothetical protein
MISRRSFWRMASSNSLKSWQVMAKAPGPPMISAW